MIAPPRAARIGWVALAIAACVNIAAGVVIALRDPGRAADLWTMYEWCRGWLIDRQSLYTLVDASTDYPPNAIVLLSPVALVPPRWLVPLWAAAAVVLTPVLPWLVLRAASGRRPAAQTLVVPLLLVLCWAAPRTLLQFSLLSLTLAAAALLVADTRPWLAGAALGVGLFKPHLTGPIALWMVVTGRVRQVMVAAALVAAGWAAYDARIAENPLTTAAGWWRAIGSQYAGAEGLVGHTSVRAWTQIAVADPPTADALWIAVAMVLLAATAALAWRDRARRLDAGGMALPAMFCLWSLLVTYHNGNNAILAVPAFAFLWFRPDHPSPLARWTPIAVLQAALVFDVPVRLHDVAAPAWIRIAIEHFDRIILLMTLALIAAIWWRVTTRSAGQHAAEAGVVHRADT
jgi:hypothetical protein